MVQWLEGKKKKKKRRRRIFSSSSTVLLPLTEEDRGGGGREESCRWIDSIFFFFFFTFLLTARIELVRQETGGQTDRQTYHIRHGTVHYFIHMVAYLPHTPHHFMRRSRQTCNTYGHSTCLHVNSVEIDAFFTVRL